MSKLSVSFAMDVGPVSQSRETRPSLVSSPSAKNTVADSAIGAFMRALRRAGKVLLNQRHLLRPAAFVRRERLCAPRERNLVEAGFCHGQEHAVRLLLEGEHD